MDRGLLLLKISTPVFGIIILIGYMRTIVRLLDFEAASTDKAAHNITSCKCEVSFSPSSVIMFNSLCLGMSQALFVHFEGMNFTKPSSSDTDILDATNLVLVENITAPFLSLDLGFNAYSLTTLSKKVRHMSVKPEYNSHCLENTSYSCVTASLARAFLTNITEESALCYAVTAVNSIGEASVKYKCCVKDVYTHKIKCGIPASVSSEMVGIFDAVVVVTAIFCVCFPAMLVNFPDEDDSQETILSNTQIRNPFYRIAALFVQKLRRHSAEMYLVDLARKLLIGFLLPIVFYVHLGVTVHSAKYDIPKMFNDAVTRTWKEHKLNAGNNAAFQVLPVSKFSSFYAYCAFVAIISFLPRCTKPDISSDAPEKYKNAFKMLETFQHIQLDWSKPCIQTINIFKAILMRNLCDWSVSHCSFCFKVLTVFVRLIILITFGPMIAIFIFIGYGWWFSPIGRMINIFWCYYSIWLVWVQWRLRIAGFNHYLILGGGLMLGIILVIPMPIVLLSVLIISSTTLLLISRVIVYVIMGVVASKDEYLPVIALVTLFVFHIWNCFSSVKRMYTALLHQTYDACKEYQEKEKIEIITFDSKGTPRIHGLSDLFQKVIDEIHPFSEAYTVMFIKMALIGSFLFMVYYSILVFGKTSLNDVTKTLAISLTGLLPKFIEMYHGFGTDDSNAKENESRVKKIVFDDYDRKRNQEIENAVALYGLPGPSHHSNDDGGSSSTQQETRVPLNGGNGEPTVSHSHEDGGTQQEPSHDQSPRPNASGNNTARDEQTLLLPSKGDTRDHHKTVET